MSDPKRYTFEAKEILDASGMVCSVGIATLTHPMGKYVSYEDYARLKAQVERLTKAGDAMRESIICGTSSDDIQAVLGWDAAKEGKQP